MDREDNQERIAYIYIQSYSCKAYVERILESVRNQTYKNWVCLVYDNGSTDGTKKVLEKYRELDSRFIVKYFEKTPYLCYKEAIPDIFDLSSSDRDFFVRIDADDDIEPDYLEKMIDFCNATDSEVVCCGNSFIDAQTDTITFRRCLKSNYLIEDAGFDSLFPYYHQFTRTHWAKIITLSVLKKMNLHRTCEVRYGNDTLFSQEAFMCAERVGILNECLYKYYLYHVEKSYDVGEERILSDYKLLDRAMEFLLVKTGHISRDNIRFLLRVHGEALKDVFGVVSNSKSKKLESLYLMLSNQYSRMCFQNGNVKELAEKIAEELLQNYKNAREEEREKIAEMLAIVRLCPTNCPHLSLQELFDLQLRMRKYWISYKDEPRLEHYIQNSLSRLSIFEDVDPDFLLRYEEIVRLILGNEMDEASHLIVSYLEKIEEMPEKYVEVFLNFSNNLFARLEREEEYVYVNKKLLLFYVNQKEYDKSKELLDEWLQILPEDQDFLEIQKELNTYTED